MRQRCRRRPGARRPAAASRGTARAGAGRRDRPRPRAAALERLPPARGHAREGFVVHLPEERRYGLGIAAFELSSAYSRQEPLRGSRGRSWRASSTAPRTTPTSRAARPRRALRRRGARAGAPVAGDRRRRAAARAPDRQRAGRCSRRCRRRRCGRCFPRAPRSCSATAPARALPALRQELTGVRRDGYAHEDGSVTPGFASVAAAVLDHSGHPVAASRSPTRSRGGRGRPPAAGRPGERRRRRALAADPRAGRSRRARRARRPSNGRDEPRLVSGP